jgi:hypothetical protein
VQFNSHAHIGRHWIFFKVAHPLLGEQHRKRDEVAEVDGPRLGSGSAGQFVGKSGRCRRRRRLKHIRKAFEHRSKLGGVKAASRTITRVMLPTPTPGGEQPRAGL